MKVTGIIAEYNPFHNGHKYQYDQIRSLSEDSFLVVVMSGNFVQRGEPSIYDKYTRTRAALNAGADLILELPTAFATSSAEDFAAAAVALLDQLGIVDELSFGSELGDIGVLNELADFLNREPQEYGDFLHTHLQLGLSFPKARNLAILDWLSQHGAGTKKKMQWDTVLSSPNNILGIEYLKALKKRDSQIRPTTILRSGQGYHDTDLSEGFASASGIRKLLSTREPQNASGDVSRMLHTQVPADAANLYRQVPPVFPQDLSLLLNERLLYLNNRQIPFHAYADISPELSARLDKQLLDFASFSGRIEQLKTKQYTYTRISRGLLHLLLDITKEDLDDYRHLDYTPYARVLGFRKEALPLLSMIKQQTAIPVITKTAKAKQILTGTAWKMFSQDLSCAHTYQAILHQKSGVVPRNEYTQQIVIV